MLSNIKFVNFQTHHITKVCSNNKLRQRLKFLYLNESDILLGLGLLFKFILKVNFVGLLTKLDEKNYQKCLYAIIWLYKEKTIFIKLIRIYILIPLEKLISRLYKISHTCFCSDIIR